MTLKILMAEFHPWDGLQVGGHKYARGFLRDGWQIFWLANFLNVNRLLRRREDDEQYIANWRVGVTSPRPGLYTYTPFALLPYIRLLGLDSHYVAHRCLRSTWPSLRKLLRRAGFSELDVLWITHPRLVSILGLVEYKTLVYRMSDDVAQFDQEAKTISDIERELCRRADLVFCTAQSLVEKASKWGANAVYLPNGVDFEMFNANRCPEPDDMASIPKPRILYLGAISDWLDVDLLSLAAQRLRNLSFVMIGPIVGSNQVATELAHLAEEPNVYILGSKPFNQVPAYMRSSDVGLIPFVKSELSDSINPIKLFEYAAAGLPIVSRDLLEVRNLKSQALLYTSAEEFITRIREALRDREALQAAGVEFGRANSWASRFQVIREEIAKIMGHD